MEHNLKTCVKKAQPFKDILKHVADKHPHSWKNVQTAMENKKWVPLLELEKAIEELQNLKLSNLKKMSYYPLKSGNYQFYHGQNTLIDKLLKKGVQI